MDQELVAILAGITIFLTIVFGALLLGQQLKINCIELVAGKPAIEIQLICK